jgi:hypothetical protein
MAGSVNNGEAASWHHIIMQSALGEIETVML